MRKKITVFSVLLILIIVLLSIFYAKRNTTKTELIWKVKSTSHYKTKITRVAFKPDTFIGKISGIITYKDKIFELDKSYYKVQVFDRNFKFLYSMARAGQGPGELFSPISFYVYKNRAFILNSFKRIEVYSTEGKFIKTIKLKNEKDQFTRNSCNSFAIYNNKIYIYYYLGKGKVQIFDMEGNYVKTFIKRKGYNSVVNPGKTYLVNLRKIYIEPSLNLLILSSIFDGSVEVYNIESGRMILKYDKFDSSVNKKIKKLIEYSYKRKNKPNVVESNVFSFFTTSYNPYTKTVWILKSEREKGNYVLYIIDVREKVIYKRLINIDENIKILGFFFADSKNKYFVDDNYDIYKLNMEEKYEEKS